MLSISGRTVALQRAEMIAGHVLSVEVVCVQLREVAGSRGAQASERRPLHRKHVGMSTTPYCLRVLVGLTGRGLQHAPDPWHSADIDGRRPVRGVDLPAERLRRHLREQALHECDGAQTLVVPHVQRSNPLPHAAPEFVLLVSAALRANVPGQFL